MKTADNYSSYQLDRLVQEIEGRLNDYEGGVSEKDETIKSFAFFIGDCAKNAVNNALADYKQSIIGIIDRIIEIKARLRDASVDATTLCIYQEAVFTLQELKQKIEEL
jgi:hypothetical protein